MFFWTHPLGKERIALVWIYPIVLHYASNNSIWGRKKKVVIKFNWFENPRMQKSLIVAKISTESFNHLIVLNILFLKQRNILFFTLFWRSWCLSWDPLGLQLVQIGNLTSYESSTLWIFPITLKKMLQDSSHFWESLFLEFWTFLSSELIFWSFEVQNSWKLSHTLEKSA